MNNNEISTACVKCGHEAGEPYVMCDGCKDAYLCRCGNEKVDPNDTLCPGCEDSEEEAHRDAMSCPTCGCPDTSGDVCDGCQDIIDSERPDDDKDPDEEDVVILAAWDLHDDADASTWSIAARAAETASITLGKTISPDDVIYVLAHFSGQD